MIATRHTFWAHTVFRFYLNRLFRKHFHAFYVMGEVPTLPMEQPVLLLPNHNSWWDGFLVYQLNRHFFNRPIYLMMLEEQLKKYPFFSRVGAFSIDRTSQTGIKESLEYASTILSAEMRHPPLVCVFPQGELTPSPAEISEIKTGYTRIIKNAEKAILTVPLAIKLLFLDQQRPEVFFNFGNAVQNRPERLPGPDKMREIISGLREEIDRNILDGNRGKIFWKGKQSVNEKWNRFQSRFFRGGK